NLPDGNLSHTLIGHTREVNAIAFTPNSQTLISGSSDRTIKIWRR
ncbi:MAG TPA: WD40 repeat domain-containing protein, partial [Allocoleopsis sp.]